LHEPSPTELRDRDGRAHVGSPAGPSAYRDRPRVRKLGERPTPEPDGAVGARRSDRSADRLAELHHGLVELPRCARGQEVREHPFDPFADGARPDVSLLPGPAGGDA